jgi:hypothetical protein
VHITVTTPGTPIWLTFLTLGISLCAVTISLWQALANNADRKIGRPQVSMSCSFVGAFQSEPGISKKAVTVSTKNLGREATTVSTILVSMPNMTVNGSACFIYGPQLKHKLKGYSTTFWAIDASMIESDHVTVIVTFDHGVILEQDCKLNHGSSKTRTRKGSFIPLVTSPKRRGKAFWRIGRSTKRW